MKILCLHGQGSSAAIFQSQTAAFRQKLDASYSFDFVNAPHGAAPAPGINAIFDSGNYAWYPRQTVPLIRDAHRWLLDYIDQHGPYDAVCCFSQGCAVVMSYLLYHARETPHQPLPFRSAMFICGGVPLAVLEDLGLPVPERAHAISNRTVSLLEEKAGRLAQMAADLSQVQRGVGLWDDTADLVHDPKVMPDKSDVFGLDFTAFPEDLRIRIPTVHVYGAKDPRWPASLQLAFFCTKKRMYDHGGGHDIPRSSEVSNAMVELMGWLRARS